MIAKWGKISLGFFILSVTVPTLCAVSATFRQRTGHYPGCEGGCLPLWMALIFVLVLLSPFNLIGAILAFVGIRKNETPRIYPRLGLALNLIIVVPTLLLIAYYSIY